MRRLALVVVWLRASAVGSSECWDEFCDYSPANCCDLQERGLEKVRQQAVAVVREFVTTPAYAAFVACAELSPEALARALAAHAGNLSAAAAAGGPRTLGARLVFIVGYGGSGTTLLAQLLSSHPEVYVGMEHKLVQVLVKTRERYAMCESEMSLAASVALAADAALGGLVAQLLEDSWPSEVLAPRKRWRGVKLVNARSVARLAKVFPRARFVHVVRDGRAAAASLVRKSREWSNIVDQTAMRPMTLDSATREWAVTERTLAYEAAILGPRYLRIRFEDLVRSPAPVLEAVARLLDVPFDPRLLRPAPPPDEGPLRDAARRFDAGALPADWIGHCDHATWPTRPIDAAVADNWKAAWSPEDDARVQDLAWDVLREAGYLDEELPLRRPRDL